MVTVFPLREPLSTGADGTEQVEPTDAATSFDGPLIPPAFCARTRM
jgi:hypothetical protein